jgi:choline dehydrogenase-like flavoprotein
VDVKDRYDCIVIGSGAGGGTLSYALAKKGVKVLLVERGDFVKPPTAHPELDSRVGFAQAEYGPPDSSSWVGGPTKFYGAALYRLRERDFEATRLETGESASWPITYGEIEPYYGQAEQIYAVHGSSSGDPTEPSRTSPYPYPPIPHQGLIKSLVERIEAGGTSVGHIPRALDYGDGGKCVLCATCDGYYCRLDAKMDAEIACIRPALATGNVDLLTGTECLRVLAAPGGKRATGVRIRQGSVESTIEADCVAVCAGLMQTPLLLRRSRTSASPEGIGNDHGCLGRYLCGHTVDMLFLVMGLRPLPAVHSKTFAINSFYGPTEEWPYPQGVIQMAGQLPVYDQPAYIRALMSRSLVCLCMSEEPSSKESGITFVGDAMNPRTKIPEICKGSLGRLSKRASRIFREAGCSTVLRSPYRNVSWHGVGTARMGTDPRSSVLDSRCRVHGFENLYVVDSSSLPSPGAVNTGLTLMAMALRAADDIAGHRGTRLAQTERVLEMA